MSSFKRRIPSSALSGTKPSPYNSLPLLSTGLSSLDDLLGGGLPLSSSLLIQSDQVTSYAELLLKFFVAQGLECKHDVIIVGSSLDNGGPQQLSETLMDIDGGPVTGQEEEADEGEDAAAKNEKLKIAFRYEGMKKHATTVEAPAPSRPGTEQDTYCSLFDLTTTRHLRPSERSRLTLIDVEDLPPEDRYEALFDHLERLVSKEEYLIPSTSLGSTSTAKPRKALRIALSNYGSPLWGDCDLSSLYRLLHRLRPLLRRSSATVMLTFPSYQLSTDSTNLFTRLAHASDGVLSLTSFASSPTSLALFPRHAGLLHIPKLPSLGSLTPSSAKLSVLRGLGGGGEGREANLGFRVKRRRFIVETLAGEDVVGGPPQSSDQGGGAGGNSGTSTISSGAQATPATKDAAPSVSAGVAVSAALPRESKVRFAGEERTPRPKAQAQAQAQAGERRSVSQIMHKQPELYEF